MATPQQLNEREEKRMVLAAILLHALASRTDMVPDGTLVNTAYHLADVFFQKSGL